MAREEDEAFDDMKALAHRKNKVLAEHSEGKQILNGTLTGDLIAFMEDARGGGEANQDPFGTPKTATTTWGIDHDSVSAVAFVEEVTCRSRPRTACYTAPRCRAAQPGSGGAPRRQRRPKSAPSHHVKTERWREFGAIRWPLLATEPPEEPKSDAIPMRIVQPHAPVVPLHMATWTRSLRSTSLQMEDPNAADLSMQSSVKPPPKQQDMKRSRGLSGRRQLRQFTGRPFSTSPRRVVTKVHQPQVNMKEWVERPVSSGKLAQDHKYGGTRYLFDRTPRIMSEVPLKDRIHRVPVTGFEI